MQSLDRLDQQCQSALTASNLRETRGLTLDRGTVEQMLNRNVQLNAGNPAFVSGAAV